MGRSVVAAVSVATIGVGLIACYLVAGPTRATEGLVATAPAFAAIVVVATVVARRPVRPVPWMLLAVGFAVAAGGEAAKAVEWYGPDGLAVPGGAQAVGLLAYPAFFVAMVELTSQRRVGRDLLAGSESIIYAVAGSALLWLAVTGPYYDDGSIPLGSRAWIWVLPLLDGLLALLAVRRVERADGDRLPLGLVASGFLAWGAAHAISTWSAVEGDLVAGTPAAASTMVGPVVLALAVALPAARHLDAGPGEPARVHWARIFGLLFAALVPLGALVLMLATGLSSPSSFAVVAVATVSVIALALVRMWHLVEEVRLLTERRGHERLAAMVEHSSDVVVLADPSGAVQYASPGLRTTLGHDPATWIGRHVLDVVVDDEREAAARQFERLVASGSGGTVEFEATVLHVDGRQRKANVVIANLLGGAAVDGIVATFRDVTEQRNLERQLSHRAFHDELTGLANRALFLDRMDHALRVARPETDPVVVLFVDLDDFKSVNDLLGHDVGDQVLRAVADRLRQAPGTGDTAARLGGDEFAILLEDRGGIDRALDVAESLLESMRAPMSISGFDVAVLASVGVAVATPGMSTTSLLRDADIAMYEAKRAGKGQIRIFDPAMRLVATKHLEYRSELGAALERDELRLVFMPFVDLRTGQVTGAEALVRWHHPEHGDVSAGEFIPIAERSGLILPLGRWVIERALAAAAGWRPGLDLSINLSVVQLREPDFVDSAIAAANRHRISPATVVFEITEAVLVDEGDRGADTVRRLRDAGFRIAIDDYGAGYCSLSQLQRQPVDLIKIDRSVIAELGEVPHDAGLARTIIQMAEALDVRTVAEGIETSSQLRELRRIGCDLGQGYLLTPPLEAHELDMRFAQSDALGVG